MAIGRLRLKTSSYDFPPWRPPSEAESLLLRVTRGCTWNRCTFCSMYRDVPFERRSREDIHRDILTAAALYREQVRTVFIGDSNSPSIKTEDLIEILGWVKEAFPHLERITSYARAKTLLKKPQADLSRLQHAGLTRLHVGLESGNGEILKNTCKGATPEEMVAGCGKAKQSGFELSLYVLLGLGGEQLSDAHARDTASVLSRIDPHFIRVRTLQPQPGSLLYTAMQQKVFSKASPLTILREQLLIIEQLQATSLYLSDHRTNYIPVEGRLPEDRQVMLQELRRSIAAFNQNRELQARCARKDSLSRL